MTDTPFHPVKAYRDESFINSHAARPLRILELGAGAGAMVPAL